MQIANPLYDVVFKYMMEDSKVAKTFLSMLIEMDIIELNFMPQELALTKKEEDDLGLMLSVYRLDFSAKIKTKEGHEQLIIIEVQKAKHHSESIRFRKYLGKQYLNKDLFFEEEDGNRTFKIGVPIYSIYFLGEGIKEVLDIPILNIKNIYLDRYSHDEIDIHNKFLKSLYHEGIIVNIPALNKKYRDELELLLSIFDQSNRMSNHHILNIEMEDIPDRIKPIFRRLQTATQVKEVMDKMELEDDFYDEISEYESRIAKAKELKEAAEKEKEAAEKEKEAAIRQKMKAINIMYKNGLPIEYIAEGLEMRVEEIKEILATHQNQ